MYIPPVSPQLPVYTPKAPDLVPDVTAVGRTAPVVTELAGRALQNQAAMQLTACMQGHGMLPDLRPVRHRQRIARPEVLIDRELAGQPLPVRAQGGVDLQGMHR